MKTHAKMPGIVGRFIRDQRAKKGLSQKELGLLLTPPVTTQFISNIERGVTPVPTAHIASLCRALSVNEAEFSLTMEQEYTARLSQKLGGSSSTSGDSTDLKVELFIRNLISAYRSLDPEKRGQVEKQLETIFQKPLS